MSEIKYIPRVLPTEATVVIPDLHAQSEVFGRVADAYGDIRYILLGDVIGRGPDNAEVLDKACEIEALLAWGNWEFYVMAGFTHPDAETRRMIQDTTRPFEYRELLKQAKSYDIDASGLSKAELIDNIGRIMQERGHIDFLRQGKPYFETEEFIAIHAGLVAGKDWNTQRQELYTAKALYDELPQIIDFSLARQQESFDETGKTVITGHAHKILGNRITAGGKRVRLASKLENGEPLYVWQSWDKKIKSFK